MTTKTQGIQCAEWLISEANGNLSREEKTVTVAGSVALASGTLLGKITATGKLIAYDNAASDGSQAVVGVLYNPLPGVNGDYKATVFVRQCEVIGSMLTGSDPTGVADMLALGIIVRT